MKIAIAGHRGFIGSNLVEFLREDQVVTLPRNLLYGDPSYLSGAIEGVDVVINLAGAPIARRWNTSIKREIEESRFGVNTRFVEAINNMEQKPAHFITASAIGIYSLEGIQEEDHYTVANHYLASVVEQWESPLQNLDNKVIKSTLRIGIVLGKEGGALVPLLKMARLGLVPIMGSGKQIYSFIHMDDLLASVHFIMRNELGGIFNICAPFPVDNATFTKKLADLKGTKLIVRIPTFLLKLVLGEAHTMVTEGPHVLPARLSREGFQFRYPQIGDAMQNLVQGN